MKLIAIFAALALTAAITINTTVSVKADPIAQIQAVIKRQIGAFKRNDGKAAFAIASPSVQKKFGSHKRFMKIVATAYPQIYRARKVRFKKAIPHGGKIIQKAIVEGPNGLFITALYSMVVVDGKWRIDGCVLIRAGINA